MKRLRHLSRPAIEFHGTYLHEGTQAAQSSLTYSHTLNGGSDDTCTKQLNKMKFRFFTMSDPYFLIIRHPGGMWRRDKCLPLTAGIWTSRIDDVGRALESRQKTLVSFYFLIYYLSLKIRDMRGIEKYNTKVFCKLVLSKAKL